MDQSQTRNYSDCSTFIFVVSGSSVHGCPLKSIIPATFVTVDLFVGRYRNKEPRCKIQLFASDLGCPRDDMKRAFLAALLVGCVGATALSAQE